MPRHPSEPGLSHLRVTIADDFYLGPGRADLMEQIAQTGSISEAARRMGMSYKRAWGLVQALNDGFGSVLVGASRGGSAQGGASLTPLGRQVLDAYRHMQQSTREAIADDVAALARLRADLSERK